MAQAQTQSTPRPILSRDSSQVPHTSVRQSITSPTPLSPTNPAMMPLPASSHRTAHTPGIHLQAARSPSPNYFGLSMENATDYGSSGANALAHAKNNWSPPGSRVRSTAAASPRVIPLDQNPDFAEFRRQTQSFGFPSARLSSFNMAPPKLPAQTINQYMGGASRNGNVDSNDARSALTSTHPPTSPRASTQQQPTSTHLPSPKQRSPKRFLPSPDPPAFDRPRRNSPAGFNDRDSENAPSFFMPQPELSRMSLPPAPMQGLSVPRVPLNRNHRSETLPITLGDNDPTANDGPNMVTPQHLVNLLEASNESVLLLDLRVSTHYARSRITGALNLCIPTTLLKRPAYNLARLADTFSSDEQRQKFEKWRGSQYIVVYDEKSAQLKDAQSCQNTLKKFATEGWAGAQYVIRGGFTEFAKRFPQLLAHGTSNGAAPGAQDGSISGDVAPVVGGCPMPASTTKTAANPFFGNIRQNMDLIGGVGQMDVKQPSDMTKEQTAAVPKWLSGATAINNHGKEISDKFLHIEKREQRRMQEALSGQVHYGTPGAVDKPKAVQLAGIEKGAKNRYNNIWPYEHSRVKLECSTDTCDYINANYMQSSRSHKRYIGTQGPIPATFDDFWNAVWQQDVRVIVMLTAEKEGGQVKAHNYWSDRSYGPLRLQFLSEHKASLELDRIRAHRNSRPHLNARLSTSKPVMSQRTPSKLQESVFFQPAEPSGNGVKEEAVPSPTSEKPWVIVRRFTLSHSKEPFAPLREITQLQYTNWPDFGAPAHPADLLGLVEQCDSVVRASYNNMVDPDLPESHPNSRPVIVHCSAGCGRTGTFCTVDSVIDMIKRQRAHRGKKRYRDGSEVHRPEDDATSNGSSEESMDVSPTASIADSHDQRDGSGPGSFDWGTLRTSSTREATWPNSLEDETSRNATTTEENKASLHEQEKKYKNALDTMTDNWLDRDDIDMIEQTVEEFRLQRLSAVQSLRQFVLCYESVLEWLSGQAPTA